MASYDLVALTAVDCIQFDGTNAPDIIAMCPGALLHPTMEPLFYIPAGHNQMKPLHVGDWLTTVAGDEFIVLPDASFQALFTPSA